MNKKAQGLSISTIVIAALAILVLVVLAVIFTGKAGLFSKTVSTDCQVNGGVCKVSCEGDLVQVYTTRDGKDIKCISTTLKACCVEPSIVEAQGMQ
jgi:hypothetical protein